METNTRYYRTKRGRAITLYNNQKYNSIKRGHNPPEYSRDEFIEWLMFETDYDLLFNNWASSGYDWWLSPSIDRLDDYKGYSFGNIRLVTWRENRNKYSKDVINGLNRKKHRAIKQLTIQGDFINEYYSIIFASKQTGISKSVIINSLRFSSGSGGGFLWEYI